MEPPLLPDRIPSSEGAAFALRRMLETDIAAMVAYRSDPAVARYQSWDSEWGINEARELFEADRATTHGSPGEWVQLVVEEAATGAVCGDVGVHFVDDQPRTVEVGVTLAPAYQGRGAATVSLNSLLAWLFDDLGAHRVLGKADVRNRQVRRLLDRLGFRHEATFVDADWFKGEWTTLCVYAMLRREWSATPRNWPGHSRHA